jgi:thiamine transport system ATP-binding protein
VISIKKGRYAYDGFALAMDFTVAHGALVAVLGPSGAGKSTLLNVLAGFERLSAGQLTIDGKDMHSQAPAAFPVSMIFQDNNVFAHLTAWQNVALGISPQLKLSDAQRAQADRALERVELSHLAQRLPGDMSGGERQRIALARVLVRDKPVLLLDEPFGALGPALRAEMLDLVATLHREKNLTALMITHAPDDAKRICDQVMFVSDGVVRAPVPTERFFLSKEDAEVRAYLG